MASVISASTTSATALNMSADTTGVLQLATGATPTTAVTIDTSQNVGIGTTSPNTYGAGYTTVTTNNSTGSVYDLNISGTRQGSIFALNDGTVTVGNITNNPLLFRTNNAERMRIDSSGNLNVGYSGASNVRIASKGADSTAGNFTYYGINSSSTLLFAVRNDGAFNTGTAAVSPYNNTTGNAANLFQGSDGYLGRSTSSIKYKTDVKDAYYGLNEVMQLRPVTYKGKNDGDKIFGGLIAEEVNAIGLTEFVQYAEDGTPDALAYGNMVSLLTKAIQEQQTIINDLKARIETLEAK